MAGFSFILGIIGNVTSLLMFASPIKTFKRIISKRSTEDYKSLPYITTLLSASLWSFYGILKPGGLLVLTVNGTGAILHVFYVSLYLLYAPKDVKVKSMKLVAVVDVACLGAIVGVTLVALHGSMRLTLVGIICAGLTIGMYAAPLSVMKTVIKTKSVEYMPFFLSLFQFLNGGVWAAYAILVKDVYIGVPNGIGFLLGSAQLILYVLYKIKLKPTTTEEGSSHIVKGIIQIQDIQENEKRSGTFLNKGISLPKLSFGRQYSKEIKKTQSLTTNALASGDEQTVV